MKQIRHKKRGSTYSVITEMATLQTSEPLHDYSSVTVYRSNEDGKVWVRYWLEMDDGRYETIEDGEVPPIDPVVMIENCILRNLFELAYEEYCFPLHMFTSDKISIEINRAVLKGLREKGLVKYVKGLMNEDGEVAGSGYCITEKGKEYINET